jgi:tetratricopeptide (TPR) repeat protein
MNALLHKITKTDAGAFLCIGLFVLAAYSFMLGSPFKTLDDDFSIVKNHEIRQLSSIPRFFTSTYFKAEKDYYRPLVYVTYAVEYRFFGLNYFYYNLDNVFLHILNAWLVFLLVLALVRERRTAFLTAFLFAIHPVHWEAVGNVSGRAILLCGFFVLSGMVLFLKYVRERKPGLLLGAIMCYALGLLSKESAGMLVLTASLYWFFVERRPWRSGWIFLPFAMVAVGYFAIRHTLGIVKMFVWPTLFEMGQGFLSFLHGVLIYVRLFFFPVGLRYDRAQWVYRSLAEPGVWLTIAAYVLIGYFVWRFYRRWSILTVFCLAWFCIELFPVSQIVTSIGVYPGAISLAEHFLYVASVPALLLMVKGGERLYRMAREKRSASPRTLQFAFLGVYLFFFIMLVQQNIYASNEYLMFRDSLKKDPLNSRIQYSLAMVYVKAGNYDKAVEHFRAAVKSFPCNRSYHIALGKALVDKGDLLAAAREYETIPPREDINKLLEGNKRALYRLLAADYEKKLRLSPRDPEILFALGVFYAKLADPARASWAFDRSWGLDHRRYDALYNLASIYEVQGDVEKARLAYQKIATSTEPANTYRQAAQEQLQKMAVK